MEMSGDAPDLEAARHTPLFAACGQKKLRRKLKPAPALRT